MLNSIAGGMTFVLWKCFVIVCVVQPDISSDEANLRSKHCNHKHILLDFSFNSVSIFLAKTLNNIFSSFLKKFTLQFVENSTAIYFIATDNIILEVLSLTLCQCVFGSALCMVAGGGVELIGVSTTCEY